MTGNPTRKTRKGIKCIHPSSALKVLANKNTEEIVNNKPVEKPAIPTSPIRSPTDASFTHDAAAPELHITPLILDKENTSMLVDNAAQANGSTPPHRGNSVTSSGKSSEKNNDDAVEDDPAAQSPSHLNKTGTPPTEGLDNDVSENGDGIEKGSVSSYLMVPKHSNS